MIKNYLYMSSGGSIGITVVDSNIYQAILPNYFPVTGTVLNTVPDELQNHVVLYPGDTLIEL